MESVVDTAKHAGTVTRVGREQIFQLCFQNDVAALGNAKIDTIQN